MSMDSDTMSVDCCDYGKMWTVEEEDAWLEHAEYHSKMVTYCNLMASSGCGELPPKPKSKMPKLPELKIAKPQLSNMDKIITQLHTGNDNDIANINLNYATTDEELVARIARVSKELVSSVKCMLNVKNFELGFLLAQAKDKKITIQLHYSKSYANKLCRFYYVFKDFYQLVLTKAKFTFLLRNLNDIEKELKSGKYDQYKEVMPALL